MKTSKTHQFLAAVCVSIGIGILAENASADYKSTILVDNPIGYWPLDLSVDLSGPATDLSGNGNAGTYDNIFYPNNKVPGPSSFIPDGVSFNGTSAWVDLSTGTNTSVLNFTGPLTLEAWVQPASLQVQQNADIFAKGWLNAGHYDEIEMSVNSSVNFGAGGGISVVDFNSTYVSSSGTVTTNWTYLVATDDGTNLNYYVNGQLAVQAPMLGGPEQFSLPWAIGNGTGGGDGRFFTGNICQVALYTNALTDAQVLAHYFVGMYGATSVPPIITAQPVPVVVYTNAPASFSVTAISAQPLSYQWWEGNSELSGQTNASLSISQAQPSDDGGYSVVVSNIYGAVTSIVANLTVEATPATVSAYESNILSATPVGYWPLDLSVDLSGPATDLSGNGNAGTYDNIFYPNNKVPGPSSFIPDGVSFNGTSAWVDLSTGTNTSILNFAGPITLEVWVQPASLQRQQNADIFGRGWANALNVDGNYDETEMSVVANYFRAGREGGIYTDSAVPVTANWTHLATTFDGTNWNLYVNGAVSGQVADTVGAASFGDPWAIANGTDGGAGRFFTGNICQVALYTNALTPMQVLAHYFVGLYGTSNLAPVITTQPVSQRVTTNTPATFTVAAVALPLPTYQWYSVIGGVTNLIAGATSATYTTGPVQDSDTGNGYFVIVSNQLNQVAGDVAILTAGHMETVTGFLTADEYSGYYGTAIAAFEALYPTASSLPAANKVEYLSTFNDNADLPNGGGERIFGWFTPPVTSNYIFFEASDDSAALWLSTNSNPANVYEIAQNLAWMQCGNVGPTDWTLSDTTSGEYGNVSTGEWRSDQFELGGGPNAYANLVGSWSAWPQLNANGSIPLIAGTKYYIELDHWLDTGGQGAAVTYKLAGNPDPVLGAASLLKSNVISASVPDTVAPEPRPLVTKIGLSGANVAMSGNNGLVNAVYNVLTSTNLSAPLTGWTTAATHRFDGNGNFSFTNTLTAGSPQQFYLLQVPSN